MGGKRTFCGSGAHASHCLNLRRPMRGLLSLICNRKGAAARPGGGATCRLGAHHGRESCHANRSCSCTALSCKSAGIRAVSVAPSRRIHRPASRPRKFRRARSATWSGFRSATDACRRIRAFVDLHTKVEVTFCNLGGTGHRERCRNAGDGQLRAMSQSTAPAPYMREG
jgi:hypothetical protein